MLALELYLLKIQLPSNLSYEQGATIPLALATAAFGLYSRRVSPPECGGAALTPPWVEGGRNKYANQPILVIGGSSAVGQQGQSTNSLVRCLSILRRPVFFGITEHNGFSVLQLAKLSGFSPIITTASSHNASYVKSLGATHVIDRTTPLASAMASITSEPVGIVYDAISEEDTQSIAYDVLAPGGALIIVSPLTVKEEKIEKSKHVALVLGTVHDPNQRALGVSMYQNLTVLLESGEVKVGISVANVCD
jgi:NADPH:quinone reductase-like Zn-dependent oxidoreductase